MAEETNQYLLFNSSFLFPCQTTFNLNFHSNMESNLSNTESPSPSPSSPSSSATPTTTNISTNTTNNENPGIHTSATTNTTPSSADTTTKPKRQRRSYSCGPCKLLKIKCDLQIPCTACKKFNRVNRCLLQPPQPPSQQELSKIQERKKRTTIKKMKLSNEFVQAYNVTLMHYPQ